MAIYWITGNSGAGKSTLAFGVQKILNAVVLDGDELRKTISTEEGFSAEDRRTHNLRVARLAKLLSDQGLLVLVSVIAPFRSVREEIDRICSPKWIYARRSGIDAPDKPYEPPEKPDLLIDNDRLTIEGAIREFGKYLLEWK